MSNLIIISTLDPYVAQISDLPHFYPRAVVLFPHVFMFSGGRVAIVVCEHKTNSATQIKGSLATRQPSNSKLIAGHYAQLLPAVDMRVCC